GRLCGRRRTGRTRAGLDAVGPAPPGLARQARPYRGDERRRRLQIPRPTPDGTGMSAPTWFAGAVETACNAALGLDPEVRARLGALDGKVIALELLGLGLRLYFFPH